MMMRTLAFVAALLVQIGLLAAMAMEKAPARLFGETVLLKIQPYDPYSILAGYYATVGYEINIPQDLNWAEVLEGQPVYTVLMPGDGGVYSAVSFHLEWPYEIPLEAIVILGERQRGRILYGIESYFLPEDIRGEVEIALREAVNEAFAEVVIAEDGTAAIVALHLAGQRY